jgi:putative hydroxymethylpyrimidine transport system permease protein
MKRRDAIQTSLKRNLSALLSIGLLFLFWHFIVLIFRPADYVLPSPASVLATFVTDLPILAEQSAVTLVEWLVGLSISVLASITFAVVCFYVPRLESMITPLLTLSQSIPTLALAPLLLIWFGIGMTPKIILVVVGCFFPIAFALLSGLQQAKKQYSLIVQMFKIPNQKALTQIYAPAALPQLFIGLRVSASYAFVAAVMVELIGSEKGLGIYLIRAQSSYRTEAVIAVVLIMVMVSMLSTLVLDLLEKRFIFWQPTHKQ